MCGKNSKIFDDVSQKTTLAWAKEEVSELHLLLQHLFLRQQQLLGNVLLQEDLLCRLGVDLSGGLRLDQNQNFAQIFSICFFP